MRVMLASCRDLPAHEHDDLPLVAALRAAGASCETAAWDDPEAAWSRADACLIRTTWDWQERPLAFLAWVDRVGAATRLFNPPELVRWNLDKRYLRQLESEGVPVVPTRWLEAGDAKSLDRELDALGCPRAFLKPVFGANALGTLRFDDDAAGRARARAHLAARREPFLLQPYLETVESRGEVSVIFVAGEITHAVRKIPRAGDYRVQDDWGATDRPESVSPELRAAATSAHALAPWPALYARADFLEAPDGRLLLTELELVEPSLFFRHAPEAAAVLARALIHAIGG